MRIGTKVTPRNLCALDWQANGHQCEPASVFALYWNNLSTSIKEEYKQKATAQVSSSSTLQGGIPVDYLQLEPTARVSCVSRLFKLTNHPPNSPIILPQSFITSFSHIPKFSASSPPPQRIDKRFSHALFERISRKLRVLWSYRVFGVFEKLRRDKGFLVALSIAPNRFLIGPALVALHHTPSSSSLLHLRTFSHFHQPISHRNPIDPIPVLKPSFMAFIRAYPRLRALSCSLAIRIFAFPPFVSSHFLRFLYISSPRDRAPIALGAF
ncbi:hypothetical protein F4604DRAFT_1927021 [Suillus subluteus]|nr:hypothetical protein F4604DRAFT_1927021 [Suillus subluteus]